MFIENDEHVIIMEEQPFSIEDLKKLEDGGVRTIFLTHMIYWNKIYSPTWNDRDWSSLDSKLEKYNNFNFKLIIPFHGHGTPPQFIWKHEQEWLSDKSGYTNWKDYTPGHIPDYESQEYIDAIDDFAFELFNRYIIDRPIQFIYAIPDDGEFLWFPHWQEHPISVESILKFILGREVILSGQNGEVWTCFHNQSGVWNSHHIADVYNLLKQELGGCPRYAVQFEHFTHNLDTQLFVKKYADEYGVRFFVGSNYIEGLRDNLEFGINQKVWGFLTAPIHALNKTKHTEVENWMLPVIQKANERLCEVWK